MIIFCAATTILLLATLTTAAVDDTCMRYGLDIDQPGASCSDIYEKNPSIQDQSGYYLIKSDHLFLAYCDKEDNGWMKVADLMLAEEISVPLDGLILQWTISVCVDPK